MGLQKTINKIKKAFKTFHCEACGKKCNSDDDAKYCIYLEKWFEEDAKSSTEVKLCKTCAEPVVSVVKKAKAFAALRKKDLELNPHAHKKPYHFGD